MSATAEETPRKPSWFNRSAFGMAGQLRVQDPRVTALSGQQYAVLIAAASFTALDARTDPVLFASATAVAERSGVSLRMVERILKHLCSVSLLEHTGRRTTGRDGRAGPVIYRLTVLREAFRTQENRTASQAEQVTRPASQADEGTASQADEGTASQADDPRYPGDPKGAKEDEEGAASRPASAGATADAAGPSTASANTEPSASKLAEIAEAERCSIEHVQSWAAFKLSSKRTGTTADRFLDGCVRNLDGPANWTPPRPRAAPATRTTAGGKPTTAKSTEAARSTSKSEPEKPARKIRPHHKVRVAQVAEAVKRSRGGESHPKIARDLNVTVAAVDECRAVEDMSDALRLVAGGTSIEDAARQYKLKATDVQKRGNEALGYLTADYPDSTVARVCDLNTLAVTALRRYRGRQKAA